MHINRKDDHNQGTYTLIKDKKDIRTRSAIFQVQNFHQQITSIINNFQDNSHIIEWFDSLCR